MQFRPLRAEEIDVRIQRVVPAKNGNKGGVVLLLYKDARVDQNILDEVVGAPKWCKKFYACKDSLFCEVGIKIENEWVFKSDCGSESNVEAKKGEASDAFKRACVNWGIGRELYTCPFLYVSGDKCRITDQGKCFDDFCVEKIIIEVVNGAKEITALSIVNNSTKQRVIVWQKEKPKGPPTQYERNAN